MVILLKLQDSKTHRERKCFLVILFLDYPFKPKKMYMMWCPWIFCNISIQHMHITTMSIWHTVNTSKKWYRKHKWPLKLKMIATRNYQHQSNGCTERLKSTKHSTNFKWKYQAEIPMLKTASKSASQSLAIPQEEIPSISLICFTKPALNLARQWQNS